jgi:hypothetical protein
MPMTRDELQKLYPPGGRVIESAGDRRWRVILPIGKDPITGKKLVHHKAIRGSKADARRYIDWINGLLSSGRAIPATIAQWELRQLQDLQQKADKLRAQLQAAVRDGAIVEPGALELPAPAAGALLPEKRRVRAAVDPTTRTRNRELLRPLFR